MVPDLLELLVADFRASALRVKERVAAAADPRLKRVCMFQHHGFIFGGSFTTPWGVVGVFKGVNHQTCGPTIWTVHLILDGLPYNVKISTLRSICITGSAA